MKGRARHVLWPMVVILALMASLAPAYGDERSVNPGINIIDQGGTRNITGDATSPVTIRNWFFDLNLDANDWPHGPQLLDAAAISSINVLGGTTTPMSFYGLELQVERTRAATSLPQGTGWVPGARAIRGQEITLIDRHMPWETPHDALAWRGLGIYAPMPADGIGRMLGTGLEIGGTAGWEDALTIVGPDNLAKLRIKGDGQVHIRVDGIWRRIVVEPDGTLKAR